MSICNRPAAHRPRATIRDVAALAGVGIKTVSRVINDEANVSAQTRERVLRAVRALNFQPHQGAGALRRGDRKTLTIGLLLDAVDNPFSAAINRAVEVVASQRDTAVFAASFDDDPERERQLVAAFTRRRVDGLILTTYGQDQGYLHSSANWAPRSRSSSRSGSSAATCTRSRRWSRRPVPSCRSRRAISAAVSPSSI